MLAAASAVQAAIHDVTTAASTGPGSLDAAISALADNDTITFHIGGAGPHVITPPVGGFAIITASGVTIDGYTQPGSSVNTGTILGTNNAKIMIVIKGSDTRTGPDAVTVTSGSVVGFIDLTVAGVSGFTDGEEALLAFNNGASDCTVRGICFEGDWAALPVPTDDTPGPAESQYAIALGGDGLSANCHISGCRFGLDPDNVTVARLKDGVAYFSGGVDNLTIGVAAGPADAAGARAQFNIFMGMYISIIGDAPGPVRISGNFFNIYPDGNTDYTVNSDDGTMDHSMEAFYEQGTAGAGVTIGTDGDGLNDAEERNVFGGVTLSGDNRFLEWYGNSPTSYVIAGNYFGLGVNGITRFTNGGPVMELVETFQGAAIPVTAQFGSDFNGVSDALEANVISWNYPFATLYPNPAVPGFNGKFRFANIDPGDVLAVRGNKFVGMETPPFTYYGGLNVTTYSNIEAQFMVPTGDYNTFYPLLSASSSSTHLKGSCAPGNSPYDSAIVIDVYKADPEGWVNGRTLNIPVLVVGGVTNGFAEGKTYVGSLRDNGPYDLNPAVGVFDFDISATGANLGLTGSDWITVTANYSDTALTGTAVGATGAGIHTSNFSIPIGLGPITITSIVNSGGGNVTISWTGPYPNYSLQTTASLSPPIAWATIATSLSGPSTITPKSSSRGFYRIINP